MVVVKPHAPECTITLVISFFVLCVSPLFIRDVTVKAGIEGTRSRESPGKVPASLLLATYYHQEGCPVIILDSPVEPPRLTSPWQGEEAAETRRGALRFYLHLAVRLREQLLQVRELVLHVRDVHGLHELFLERRVRRDLDELDPARPVVRLFPLAPVQERHARADR